MTRLTTQSEKVAWIRGYFLDTVVKGYMVGDLKRMLEIEIRPGDYGNCNFPIALSTLACMDYLGYLISGKQGTESRIKAYVDGAFTEQYKKQLDPVWYGFVNVFRNGLAHEYFPKRAGVSRVNTQIMSWSGEHKYWVLDADRLAEAFIESVSTLESLSDDMCATMYERHEDFLTPEGPTMASPTSTTTSSTPSDKTTTTLQPGLEAGGAGYQGDDGIPAIADPDGDTGVSGLTTQASQDEAGPELPES